MKGWRDCASAIVGVVLTLSFLALAARNVKVGELWVVLRSARWGWIAAMAAVSGADLVIRSVRWRLLLSRAPGRKAGLFLLFRLEAIGLAMNNVLFMRVGELARGFLAGRELGLPLATALSSVAVERALDVAALLALFCGASLALPGLVEARFLRGALLVLGACLLVLGVLAFAEEKLASGHPWEKTLRAWPRLHDLVSQLAAGASVLRGGGPAAAAAGLSLLLWGVDAGFYWFGARALGLGGIVDYPRAVLILSWAGAAAAVPTAPGGFGSFELAVQTILGRLGASPQQALGYALFSHMVGYIAVTLIGLAFLWRVGFSLGELKAALEREKAR
ncbi:MAG: flippase-like domain-containing protein [Elusimicrobia bacterium]|nr:flippase-like domain-containing protein [Elusimicrobiota bacterium]